MSRYFKLLPHFLLLVILPLGVAGQNLGSGIIGLLLIVQLYQQRRTLAFAELWRAHKVSLSAVAGFLLMQVTATFLNPASPERYSIAYVGGHLIWALFPPAFFLVTPRLTATDWRRFYLGLTAVCVTLGLVSLSQAIWGWRIDQTHLDFGYPRAQGLYSHPMSFAYVCLVLAPFVIMGVCRWHRQRLSWVMAASLLVAIYASESRMVELVTGLVVMWNIWRFTKGRSRLWILGLATVVGITILTTNNPVGERFRGTLRRHDVRSDYADDRLAFWHANFNMLRERPLLGHGEGLDTAYRAPYYEAIGLKGFIRQYEAHNMYLQVAVNLGLIGLVIFLVWLGDLYAFSRRLARAGMWAGSVGQQTVVAFCLAAITQNAFQDSTVRFTFTVLIAALWIWARDDSAGMADGP